MSRCMYVFTLLLLIIIESLLLLPSSSSSVSAQKITTQQDVMGYLQRYGYINTSENAITNIERALVDFQETYNLPVDGTLNKETLRLINKPRCTKSENAFTTHSKWNKKHLKWYFPQATQNAKYLEITKKAFDVWAQNTTLTFEYVRIPNPRADITIVVTSANHRSRYNCQGNQKCSFLFDGAGGELAHSYFPNNDKCIEIHVDRDEAWYIGDGETPEGQHNLFAVLTHEIGHALGLGHSSNGNAVMYPWYQDENLNLDEDDLMAIESLYGRNQKFAQIPQNILNQMYSTTTKKPKKSNYTAITKKPTKTTRSTTAKNLVKSNNSTTASTASTAMSNVKKIPQESSTNLCNIKIPDFMFLATAPSFPNYRMYVGHDTFLWKLDLNDMHIPLAPELIADYLPKERRSYSISHIFQNSVGDLITITNQMLYAVSFPNLNIQNSFNLPINIKSINALFQTNSGQIYLLYNNNLYIEFNETGEILNRGQIRDLFHGIPEDLTSAFRYTDGHIYFFTNNTYYKYSEYTKKVVEAGSFSWNLFGIPCPDDGLLNQLKTMLRKIISFYE